MTNGRTLDAASAFLCWTRNVSCSIWPLRVFAGHTQPSEGFLAASQRNSRIARTRGVIGRSLRAALVLPRVIMTVPCRPPRDWSGGRPDVQVADGITTYGHEAEVLRRSEERRVGKECRS